MAVLLGLAVKPAMAAQTVKATLLEAVVKKITPTKKSNPQTHRVITVVTLEVVSGAMAGKTITTQDNTASTPNPIHYKVGDHVVVTTSKDAKGADVFYITDYI